MNSSDASLGKKMKLSGSTIAHTDEAFRIIIFGETKPPTDFDRFKKWSIVQSEKREI